MKESLQHAGYGGHERTMPAPRRVVLGSRSFTRRYRGRGARPGWVVLLALLASAAVLVTAAYLLQYLITVQTERDYRADTKLTTVRLARELEQSVRDATTVAERLAKAPSLADALARRPAVWLHDKEEDLRGQLPTVLRVGLFRAGTGDADILDMPDTGYACLDMARRAEASGTAAPAEIHLSGKAGWHVDVMRPIPRSSDGAPAGYLLLSVDGSLLQQNLVATSPARGYLELRQGRDGVSPVVIALRGDPSYRNGMPEDTIPVPGTAWDIAYWSAPLGSLFSSTQGTLDRAVFGGALAVLSLVLFLLFPMTRCPAQRHSTGVVSGVRGLGWYNPPDECLDGSSEPVMALTQPVHLQGKAGTGLPHHLTPVPNERESTVDHGSISTDPVPDKGVTPDASIFRGYDIRGIVSTVLTPEVVYEIGRAIGSEAYERGQQSVLVGRDGRLSSPELAKALSWGLQAAGRDVIDIGRVPTPVLYFATHYLGTSTGVMVTGSHNPPEYNGLKIVMQGETLAGDGIQALRRRLERQELSRGSGDLRAATITQDYLTRITSDVRLVRPLKVVVDCGNGAAGVLAPRLFRMLGCEVTELYCEIDGRFPNHHPDPSQVENLADLIRAVQAQKADVGLAFDGDADRVGVVASDGAIIWPDRVLMLLAIDVLTRNPGAEIIYDVKCSRGLEQVIRKHGGRPLMWRTGHSVIKAKMRETGALLAGEMSGHIFFGERWFGFDDGLYAAARLLEVLAADPRSSSAVFTALPDSVNTPELRVEMAEGEPYRFMERLLAEARFEGARVTDIDGLRADFAEGWGLVRASNTTPSLTLRFEAQDEHVLRSIQQRFREAMRRIDPGLRLPF